MKKTLSKLLITIIFIYLLNALFPNLSFAAIPPPPGNCGTLGNSCCTGRICYGGLKCSSTTNKCITDPAKTALCVSGIAINTAIGCIPISSTSNLVGFFLRWAIGLAGGIAFLFIVYATFLIITSAGNPQRLGAGKELLGSAITGLLMIMFSVYILRVIGVDILGLGQVGL